MSETDVKKLAKKYPNEGIIKILFIGDIVGRPGRRAVKEFLALHKNEYDLVVANGENLASGKGMTYNKYQEMIDAGVDYLTSGNHIWNNEDIIPHLNDSAVFIIRPANYQKVLPGRGFADILVADTNVKIINLQGRVFMKDDIDDPFVIGKNIIDEDKNSIILVDFHAEATSEKIALGYYLDGRASAVLGTHTHVQTADEKILPKGTAYITDLGMCGPVDSVLGVKKEIIIEKFLTELPLSHKIASGNSQINAVEIEVDKSTKKAVSIKRISEIFS